jgi:DNA-binding GntR family transcriptional regulator
MVKPISEMTRSDKRFDLNDALSSQHIEIKNVTHTILDYLRTKIITGEFEAGQKLNETSIASRLGISRHPLREAFRILENEHLIVTIPRRGAYINDLSIQELKEFYQAREMIELYAIDNLRAKRITELPIVASSLEHSSSLEPPDMTNLEQRLAYYRAFTDFHIKLIESASNKLLVQFYKSIYIRLSQYQILCLYMPESNQRSVQKEHRQILSLLQAGAYEKAKKLVKVHLSTTYQFLEETTLKKERNRKK